jgi:protein-S-isoprenylcysteine O-methyltransferase Ste14
MLLGIGILANSLVYVFIVIPVFLFIYQAIVIAEEDFLRKKFGTGFDQYCRQVNRWWPNLKGFSKTFSSMSFKWKRWIIKEHTTQLIWLIGITLILFLNYPELTGQDTYQRNIYLIITLGILLIIYTLFRYLYKSGKLKE